MVPVAIDGLEMRVYKPAGDSPVPTLVFNHGSTGSGTEPSRFTWPLDYPPLARSFVERGWAVVIPARRGARWIRGRLRRGLFGEPIARG
jgi:dipeptidyl aminopeptidase/acylaminoacyl peptidase